MLRAMLRPSLALLAVLHASIPALAQEPDHGDGETVLRELARVRAERGIQSLERIDLGGTPQWVSIRGADRANPILLFLHGGPGDPGIGVSWAYQRPWEDFFTVVQWDQRGGGKNASSLDLTVQTIDPELTIERLILDAEELLSKLRERFDQEKVLVVGHSWGTILGVHLARRRPEWLHAYVGVGQVGHSMRANEEAVYRATLDRARRLGRIEAVAELEAIGPYPPVDADVRPEQLAVVRSWVTKLGGSLHGDPDGLALYFSLPDSSPDYTDAEAALWPRAASRVIWHLARDRFFRHDLDETGHELGVPIVLVQGRYDLHTPPDNARSYLDAIEAPRKEWILFEQSAHVPHLEEPGRFLHMLVDTMASLAEPEGSVETAR